MEIRPMEREQGELLRLASVFERNGDPKDRAVLEWRYYGNPTGKLIAVFAVDGVNLAGFYAVSPMQVVIEGRIALAAQSLDTLTDVGYRGRGVFSKLASATYTKCSSEGVELVYGFPNGSSSHGFFGRLGWSRLDPVPFLIRPLRPSLFVRRIGLGERAATLMGAVRLGPRARQVPSQLELRPVWSFDDSFTRVWRRFASRVGVAVDRTAEFLQWRFLSNPIYRYQCLGLYRDNQLVGFVVFRAADKHGGRIGYVMELLYDGIEMHGRVLLDAAIRELDALSVEAILAWCFEHSPNYGAYRDRGFLPLPERIRPIELHFGCRKLAGLSAPICNRQSWYLSYTDSDTV